MFTKDTNLKFDGIQTIQNSGKLSEIVKFHPEDCDQKGEGELEAYFQQIESFLNSIATKSNETSWAKFYQLNGNQFVNTSKQNLAQMSLQMTPGQDAIDYFMGEISPQNSVLINKDDYVKVNSKYFRLISIDKHPPLDIQENYLSNARDYVVLIKRTSRERAKAKMEFTRRIFRSVFNKNLKDIAGENAYEQAETFLENIINGSESYFEAEIYFIVRADTEDELQRLTEDSINYLEAIDVKTFIETEGLDKIFPSILPGTTPGFFRKFPVDTKYLKFVLPLTKDNLWDQGIEFYSANLNPVHIDISNKASINYNAVITGTAGQGKTVLAQKIAHEELKKNAKGVILDFGNTFSKFAQAHNATIFSDKFNPLTFRDAEYLQALIVSKIPENEINEKTKGKILKEIKSAIENDIQTFKGLIDHLETTIPDIGYYFEDIWNFISDEPTPISDLIYVDTTHYPTKIIGPLIVFILECFDKMEGRRIFVFDECWAFLETISEWLEKKFRTFRHSFASGIAISQNIDDFSETKVGKVILQNCSHKFMLRQTITDEKFFTQGELELIQSISSSKGNYSEIYYKSEFHKKVIRYYQNKHEYHLFTSERRDNLRLEMFFKEIPEELSFQEKFELYLDFADRGAN
jgi:hypothetical protein